MFAICYEKPNSSIIQQISSAQLPPWGNKKLSLSSSIQLDSSQEHVISSFLSAPNNGLYLLQGPPGTGKTTTITALIQECVNKNLRILVSAPSNKAVQEIASRFFQLSPSTKIMLAGVEKKLANNLFPIFVHGRHNYMLMELTKTTLYFVASNNLIIRLSKNDVAKYQSESLNRFDFIANQLIKFQPKIFSELKLLRNNLQESILQLMNLNNVERQQWLRELQSQSQSSVIIQDLEQYQNRCKQIQKDLTQLSTLLVDSEDNELFILDQSEVIFASLTVCGRQSMRRMQNPFDLTIIDEAGQAVSAETLIPFHFPTKKALLVGDPMQLAATTISETAIKTHFAESTLSRLIFTNHTPYEMLRYQYRMDPEIRAFPSSYFYQDQLIDGPTIINRANPIPKSSALNFLPYSFISVNSGKEIQQGTSFLNMEESKLTKLIIKKLQSLLPVNIKFGVITFYRAQVDNLQKYLEKFNNVVVSTVDGFQGGESDIIIISCVRSNVVGHIGFARDFRRINVAITRARFGLIILGNAKTLSTGDHTLSKLITDANSRNKIYSEKIFWPQRTHKKTPPRNHNLITQSSSSSKLPHNYKTQPCMFFAHGYCKKGDACTYRHDYPMHQ